MVRCSIVIPVYNEPSATRACLDTLAAQVGGRDDVEIVVVDDGSSGTTRDLLRGYADRVRVVTHGANTGYAVACNDGAAAASGELLVLLNNDTVPAEGWLDRLVAYADAHPAAAAVGCKLVYPNRTVQHAGVVIGQDRLPRNLYVGFPQEHPAVNQSRRFQAVTAACVLVRRTAFREAGGFDPAYRNGLEDVDLCLRLGGMGHEVHYCHESVVVHLESVSEGRFAHGRENLRLYLSRWGNRVTPDDVLYFARDGLIRLSYADVYPHRIEVSPLLATGAGGACEAEYGRLLCESSRQVAELLKENIRTTLRAGDGRLRYARVDEGAAGRVAPVIATAACPALVDRARGAAAAAEADDFLRAQQEWIARDRDLYALELELRAGLAALETSLPPAAVDAGGAESVSAACSRYARLRYRLLIRQIQEIVDRILPAGAVLLCVSKGDEGLVQFRGKLGWHFPSTEDGGYAGRHPDDDREAIHLLETCRSRGAGFLLFPSSAFWWFGHYQGLAKHLSGYRRVWADDSCIVFDLRTVLSEPEGGAA